MKIYNKTNPYFLYIFLRLIFVRATYGDIYSF